MIPYDELLKNRKTPFYVFDQEGFIANYHALENAMCSVYPNYAISYSYKTNYTPYICKLVKILGGYAEVVSDMEYMLAKKLGYSNERIVYNGPVKGPLLEEHLLNDGIVNIDSLDEAERISFLAKRTGKKLRVGLRINIDVGGDFISRFGLSPTGNDIEHAITILNRSNVKIVGLHCHISRCRGIDAWKKRADIMLQVAGQYIKEIPEYISLGSGMFADMESDLKKQFTNVPTYEEYARETLTPFAEHYPDKKPVIFTEPGTTVIARYLNFVSTVQSIKNIRGRFMANMDGSYENLGEICTMKKLPLRVIHKNESTVYQNLDIMGYTCLEQDLMYSGYSGMLSPGDVIVFGNTGGYSIVSKPQFIQPNCSMIAYLPDNTIKEIMREETFDDVFSKFKFAE